MSSQRIAADRDNTVSENDAASQIWFRSSSSTSTSTSNSSSASSSGGRSGFGGNGSDHTRNRDRSIEKRRRGGRGSVSGSGRVGGGDDAALSVATRSGGERGESGTHSSSRAFRSFQSGGEFFLHSNV